MQTLPPMSCAESFKLGWVNYAKFSGRARRSEFFYFYLIISAIISIFYLIYYINLLDNYNTYTGEYENQEDYVVYLYICAVICLVTFLPILGLEIRRLHDTGRSGWFVLLRLIPFIGDILLLVLFCIDSESTTNEYGPSPKYVMPSGNLLPGNNYNPPIVPYPQTDPVVVVPVTVNPQPQPIPYPQQNPVPIQQPPYIPQNTPYSQATSNQQPPQGAPYPSFNDPYSKPNSMQTPSDNNY